jgi:hypothetical protein
MMIRSRALSAAGRGHRGLREIGSYFEVKLASVVRHVEDRVERFARWKKKLVTRDDILGGETVTRQWWGVDSLNSWDGPRILTAAPWVGPQPWVSGHDGGKVWNTGLPRGAPRGDNLYTRLVLGLGRLLR